LPAGNVCLDVANTFGADLPVSLDAAETDTRIGDIAPCLLCISLRGLELWFEIFPEAHRHDVRFNFDVPRLRIGQVFVGACPLRRDASQTRLALALLLFERSQLLAHLRQLVLPLAPELTKAPFLGLGL